MRLLSVLLVLLATAACASGPAPEERAPSRRMKKPTAADHRAVAELRGASEALLEGQAELFWEAWTTGAPVALDAFYASYAGLFSTGRLEALRRVRHAEEDVEARRALLFLESWLAGEILARAAVEESRELARLEAGATFTAAGETHGWRELEPMLAAEADPERRAAIQAAALPVLEQLGTVLARKRQRIEAAAVELGYEDATAAAAALRLGDRAAIAALAAAVLDATDPLHDEVFGAIARSQLGVEFEALRRADMPRLFAGLGIATHFSGDARTAWNATLAGLGLDAGGIRIETAAPAGRPLAFPVSPPEDVRLALPEQTRNWAPTFHEGGAALHAVQMEEGPFEFTVLGHPATAEAFAVLFENLTSDVAWLREHTQMTAAEGAAHASAAAARRLRGVRRNAGRLIAATATGGTPASNYRAAMERAYGLPLSDTDAAWHAVDRDEWLFGADALQAWILAAMLEEHLVASHGAAWWRSPEAGAELRALQATGNRLSPDEVAARIGAEGLDPQALVRGLRSRLGALPAASAAGSADADAGAGAKAEAGAAGADTDVAASTPTGP